MCAYMAKYYLQEILYLVADNGRVKSISLKQKLPMSHNKSIDLCSFLHLPSYQTENCYLPTIISRMCETTVVQERADTSAA